MIGEIPCPTCDEPTESFYLRHPDFLKDAGVRNVPDTWSGELTPHYRKVLAQKGWVFAGANTLTFTRCNCCPDDKKPDIFDAEARAALADLFGDDLDGLQVSLEDMGY